MSDDAQNIQYRFNNTALIALENGYHPLPIIEKSKRPAPLENWRAYCWKKPALQTIAQWDRQWPNAGLGLACGRSIAVIDIDYNDPKRSKRAVELATQILGETQLKRRARPNHVALVYRAKEPIISGQCGLIDILGLGKQMVAFGEHPRTAKDYSWLPENSPTTVGVDELPSVDNALIQRFMEAVVENIISDSDLKPELAIDSTVFIPPMTSLWILASQLFYRYAYGRFRTRERARKKITHKYYDTGAGLKIAPKRD